jgi:PAS domain S-box-containing protein
MTASPKEGPLSVGGLATEVGDEDPRAALRRMRAQQDAISVLSLSDAFVAGDVDQLARQITEIATSAVGVERANVWLFNEGETELRCIDLYEATPRKHSSGMVLAEADYRAEFAALRHGRFVDADDASTDPRTAGYVEGYVKPLGITSMLDALVAVSGHRLGLLCLEHVNQPHHWERDEVAFACQLADKIALTMVNRARREAQETLRASEERFAGAFEHAPIGVALVSLDGRFLKVNRALGDLTGYTEADLLGRTFQEITHPDDLEADLENLRQLVALRTRSYQMEKRYLHARGHWIAILLSVSLLKDRQGAPQHLIAQIQDITERKQAEADLQASLQEKKALLREVHHRVKNNLQVITSLLRLEAARSEEPGTKVVLRDMQGRILSMALLHETLYRTGDFGRVDLGQYLKQLAERFYRAQSSASGKVRLDLDLQPVFVGIDQAIPCGLIVNEMLTNSFKHGFDDQASGEVRLELREKENESVWLQESDNGVGLPADFEGRRERSLGLQLISDLSRQLGGRLEISPGPGARFTLTFTKAKPHPTGGVARPLPDGH